MRDDAGWITVLNFIGNRWTGAGFVLRTASSIMEESDGDGEAMMMMLEERR